MIENLQPGQLYSIQELTVTALKKSASLAKRLEAVETALSESSIIPYTAFSKLVDELVTEAYAIAKTLDGIQDSL